MSAKARTLNLTLEVPYSVNDSDLLGALQRRGVKVKSLRVEDLDVRATTNKFIHALTNVLVSAPAARRQALAEAHKELMAKSEHVKKADFYTTLLDTFQDCVNYELDGVAQLDCELNEDGGIFVDLGEGGNINIFLGEDNVLKFSTANYPYQVNEVYVEQFAAGKLMQGRKFLPAP